MPELISPLELAQESEPGNTPVAEPTPPEDLGAVRELVLRAHPDVVPELVTGATVAALLASIEPARAAYARVASTVAEARPAPRENVPAGGGVPITVDPDRLPASEKIRRGLATAAQKG